MFAIRVQLIHSLIMRGSFHTILLFTSFLVLNSCKKKTPELGIETVIKGHVSDTIRGINISGYKIELDKSWTIIDFAGSRTVSEEVATAYTDTNGNYSITFNYKLKDGESYTWPEQYYGTPYYPEYLQPIKIIAGNTNIVNINAWAPIKLNLNLQILNNNNGPLHVRNVFNNGTYLEAVFIYDQNITNTYSLRSRPGSDINIIFWYLTGSNSNLTTHQKTIPYHTPLNDVALNFIIDCSTF